MTRRRLKKGGAIGETIATVEGIPVGKNVVVTNSKGMTRSLVEHNPFTEADTAAAVGDNDI